jgi:hypothetical protein
VKIPEEYMLNDISTTTINEAIDPNHAGRDFVIIMTKKGINTTSTDLLNVICLFLLFLKSIVYTKRTKLLINHETIE